DDPGAAVDVVADDEPLPDPARDAAVTPGASLTGSSCPPDDVWQNASLDDPPPVGVRDEHSAVWTGSRLILWGGSNGAGNIGTGLRYDPATNTTTPVSMTGAPLPRAGHVAIWTGTLMLVWGGTGASGTMANGARYDPVADAWSPISTINAPSPRESASAVW